MTTSIDIKLKDILIISFIKQCLDHGIEFNHKGELLYPISSIIRALYSGREIEIIFPGKEAMNG